MNSILIVEDDPSIASLVSQILKIAERPNEVALTEDEALRALAARDYSLVLLDYFLDGHTGAKIAELLRARGTPFILMTAGQDPETLARSVGASFCLSKPFDIPALLDAVQRAGRPLSMPIAL